MSNWYCIFVPKCVFCSTMEFNLEDFVSGPTRGKLEACTKANLAEIAERFDISISRQDRKQVIKDQLVERGLMSAGVGAQGVVTQPKAEEVGLVEQVRLRELELELRQLDLKEKEIDCSVEVRKLEEETKWVLHFKGVRT